VSVTCLTYAVEGWGEGQLWSDGNSLVWHELPHPAVSSRGTHARARVTPSQKGGVNHRPPSSPTIAARSRRVGDGSESKVQRLVQRIQAYFAGEPARFDDVELELGGWTPFQLALLRALRQVPYGEVVSYGDLARLAGRPRAQRAAGTFCARNRFGLIVPCHRVVSAEGLGSYGSLGVDYKRRLLSLEGVSV
jgi:O-6-methylguanine DNA methyltransferase